MFTDDYCQLKQPGCATHTRSLLPAVPTGVALSVIADSNNTRHWTTSRLYAVTHIDSST